MQQREEETFGALLQRFRLRAGLAQNALSRMTGINVGTVNRLERDQRLPASRDQVLALAGALALSMAETNRMLNAAGLPAEGFGPAITGNPAIVQLVNMLQDETIPATDRDELLTMVQHYVNLVARANGRAANP
jgi:transcriptional regulator with XRE-family HTH domain